MDTNLAPDSKHLRIAVPGSDGAWKRSRVGQPIHGFTLVELLVVIAILGLLASLLLPALGRSKSSSRRVVCLGNLRQMTLAAAVYTADHEEAFPHAYYHGIRNGIAYAYAWDLTTVRGPSTVEVIPGLLWNGQGPQAIQQCPAFAGKATWLQDPFTGYNYNTSYLGHGEFESIPDPARASAVRRPNETLIFGDGQFSGGANKFMRAPWPNPGDATFHGRWAGTQGFRHARRTNAAFTDGHVDSLSERFTASADDPSRISPETGFLSADNALYDLD